MRQLVLAIATIIMVGTISPATRADMVGAAAGAGSGLLVAGPVGAGSANQSRCVLGRQRFPSPLFVSSVSSILTARRRHS
jgi:hypothetical protein